MARTIAIVRFEGKYAYKIDLSLGELENRLERENKILKKIDSSYEILKKIENYTNFQFQVIESAVKNANKNKEELNLEGLFL